MQIVNHTPSNYSSLSNLSLLFGFIWFANV